MHWRTRHTHIRTRYYTDFGQRHAAGSRAHKQDEQSRERTAVEISRTELKTPPFSCFPSLSRSVSFLYGEEVPTVAGSKRALSLVHANIHQRPI